MKTYIALEFRSTDELAVAWLSNLGFESFLEEDDYTIAYIPASDFNVDCRSQSLEVVKKFTDDYKITEIQPQNWNALWESSFQPVSVEDFCRVRADFHPADETVKYDLVINPKMAFGTGHHATTWMMIKQMADIDFKDKEVLDFGCGTGILAILASKLKASVIDAVDIEEESYDNTIENSLLNQTPQVNAYLGGIHDVSMKKYDIILANINRNVLIEFAEDVLGRMKADGILLLSGILKQDLELVTQVYENLGFKSQKLLERENWCCLKLTLYN